MSARVIPVGKPSVVSATSWIVRRKMSQPDQAAMAEYECVFDGVFQLSDIARPFVMQERSQGLAREAAMSLPLSRLRRSTKCWARSGISSFLSLKGGTESLKT